MIKAEFQPTLFSTPEEVHTEHPYVKLEVYRRDPANIYVSRATEWIKSHGDIYDQPNKGYTVVGLHKGRNLTSGNLSKSINIKKGGKYWILLRINKTPESTSNTIGLEIDGKMINTFSAYGQWIHYKFLDFGYLDLEEGTHQFKIYLNGKRTWVEQLLMYRLEYFSSEEKDSNYRLDWKEIEFTENAIGDLNSAEITLSMNESWNDPNQNIFSRKHFDYLDMVNIIVGDSDHWGNAKVKFGGYIIGYDEADDGSEITLSCADRLLDLYRRPVYTNYYIGVAPASDETCTFPMIKFGSALEAIRYTNETSEYSPLSYGIIYPYALDMDYRLLNDYETVAVSGFEKDYSPSTGLRLGYSHTLNPDHCGVTPDLNCSGVLFNNPTGPVDAAIHDMLCIKYLAAGESCGESNRVQFNIQVSMYKAGQNPTQALTYTILWTGKQGATRVIGQATPVLDGTEQLLKFDLKAAFDKYAPSSNYYVTKIELVDTASLQQVRRRESSVFHILSLIMYDKDLNVKMKVNQETSYPYDVLSEILTEMGFVGYVDYGRERREDVLCIAPEMNEKAPVDLVEGVNILNITDKSYDPKENIRNAIYSHYHYKEGQNEKTGASYIENIDSVPRYGPGAWEHYEDRTDVSKKTDAEVLGRRFVEENSYPIVSFTLEMKGTTLLNPSQYIVASIQKEYLQGNYSTKTATHTISREGGYITRISVNRPGSYYDQIMVKIDKKMNEFLNKHSDSMYSRSVLNNMSLSGLGAFIRERY